MKAYSYDYRGIFIGEIEAEQCQVTELRIKEQSARQLKEGEEVIQPVYILPNYATLIAPPEVDEDSQAVFNGSEWYTELKPVPEPEEVEPETELTYQQKRAAEYPSMFEYLDGVVKSHSEDASVASEGHTQIEKYISDCLAVKEKYPKPL